MGRFDPVSATGALKNMNFRFSVMGKSVSVWRYTRLYPLVIIPRLARGKTKTATGSVFFYYEMRWWRYNIGVLIFKD